MLLLSYIRMCRLDAIVKVVLLVRTVSIVTGASNMFVIMKAPTTVYPIKTLAITRVTAEITIWEADVRYHKRRRY